MAFSIAASRDAFSDSESFLFRSALTSASTCALCAFVAVRSSRSAVCSLLISCSSDRSYRSCDSCCSRAGALADVSRSGGIAVR